MQKLDRLGWAAGMAFSAYGLRIGIRSNQAELPSRIVRQLPFQAKGLPRESTVDQLYSLVVGHSPRDRVRQFNLVYENEVRVARTPDYLEAMDTLLRYLHQFVALESRREIFLHAGVVVWNSRAILIPGASFSGKSTLTAAFVQAGATYYSDEYALVDHAGRVLPYPLPITLRERARNWQSEGVIPTGGVQELPPVRASAVLFTRFSENGRWKLRRLSPAYGVLGLLQNTLQAQTRPGPVLSRLQKIAAHATMWKTVRGEAEEALADILNNRAFLCW